MQPEHAILARRGQIWTDHSYALLSNDQSGGWLFGPLCLPLTTIVLFRGHNQSLPAHQAHEGRARGTMRRKRHTIAVEAKASLSDGLTMNLIYARICGTVVGLL